jgi:hypothetical protein
MYLHLEKNYVKPPHLRHLQTSDDLVTTYEATHAGFVALALEKNRRATPYVAEARALQEAASQAHKPADLLTTPNIETGLLTAAGLSNKALTHLQPEDKTEAIKELIRNFLEPAGAKFIEELIFRFLLTRGDTLGGSMRNIGGVLAQRKLTRAILSSLAIAGVKYTWQHVKTRTWVNMTNNDSEIELFVRGIHWRNKRGPRTLLYNLTVPLVHNNVDLCLFNLTPEETQKSGYALPETYLVLGELKGGIDPAGADEHWKTARTALERIRQSFHTAGYSPYTFFIGAAVERKMASELWNELKSGILTNAANLNQENQIASISNWLCSI